MPFIEVRFGYKDTTAKSHKVMLSRDFFDEAIHDMSLMQELAKTAATKLWDSLYDQRTRQRDTDSHT